MSNLDRIAERLAAAENAFAHADGRPKFEPEVNASRDAEPGEVAIQKACRLLEVVEGIDDLGAYYGAILEHSFIVIEQTLQGYLFARTGVDERELRNHTAPYELAKGRVPLEDRTLDRLAAVYDDRRMSHYYGTTVTTAAQANRMREVAMAVHDHLVSFDGRLGTFCRCTRSEF
ncbi:hypothetical protein PM085_13475 [Halorubrum ezzemoulense]|uniref:DUF8154 domain-containing protein n=1 Tax=Halorubrum ezzemoulense TaxID=337243 RepID=A0ABT4Z6A4_HALEZ|nr:hypothetical protein [Halorubrum ezzemoulense]MDB2293283.1 hypothetical protein [Halorubrum ezzemoulense]